MRCILVQANLRLSGMYCRRPRGGRLRAAFYLQSGWGEILWTFTSIQMSPACSIKSIMSTSFLEAFSFWATKNGANAPAFILPRRRNRYHKFGVIIRQNEVLDRIFASKKDKQRYLDYAFKIGLKRKLQALIMNSEIDPGKVRDIYVLVDEHSTATNGHYELREALEAEFKNGTYNFDYSIGFAPIFPRMNDVCLFFKDSSSTLLVRAADVVANRIYHQARKGICAGEHENNLFVTWLP